MYIKRDITQLLSTRPGLAQILIGPRQCGKSTLLDHISNATFKEITFDDLQMHLLANRDPALFLKQFPPPVLLDEVQYVPQLFPEIKQCIDKLKRQRLYTPQASHVLFIPIQPEGTGFIV